MLFSSSLSAEMRLQSAPILCHDTLASPVAVVVGATGLKLQAESAVKICLPSMAQINVPMIKET